MDVGIEYILQEFTKYLNTNEDIDVIHCKFGYLFLIAFTSRKNEFIFNIIDSPESAYDHIIDYLVQDYLYEKSLSSEIVPKENILDFYQWMGSYMDKALKYRYILDKYIEKN